MPVRYVTYSNGLTEIFGDDRTPAEEREWLNKASGVSKFPSVNYLTSLKPVARPPLKPKQEEKSKYSK
jgi:hypothetical protein